MKKVLITGTCGFILGHLIRSAVHEQNQQGERQYICASVDRVNFDNNPLFINKNHAFYPADIRDDHVMDVIFRYEQPDVVIHGAAETHVDNSLVDPNSFVTSNVLGTQVIINCCLKYKVKKLVYISTDEVLGQLTSDSDPPWTEDSPLNPRSPYSATKAAGELLVKAAHTTHGLIYNITRSSNCYGPRQQPEKLIPKAIKRILDGEKIPLYGQGLQIRDWTYVTDNCSAIMTVMEKGAPNEVYNISANQEFTNLETIHEVCNAMGAGHNLIDFVAERPGHDFRYSLDTTKLRNLGWAPAHKFKDGARATVEWYTKNRWFLK